MYKEATRNNVNYFLTYGNGKAIARIVDNLRPNGAHRWYNYAKAPKYGNLSVFKMYFLLLHFALSFTRLYLSFKMRSMREKAGTGGEVVEN